MAVLNTLLKGQEVNLPEGFEKLNHRCFETARKKYGDPLPAIVQNRLESELNVIEKNGYAGEFLAGAMLADRSRENAYPVSARGKIGSSFVAYLCGISGVNPLPAHYWCPQCHCVREAEKGFDNQRLIGYDLPEKKCICGTKMQGEGACIDFEILTGFYYDRKPEIFLGVAKEVLPELPHLLNTTFGDEIAQRFGLSVLPELSMLAELERATGVSTRQINTHDRGVLDAFRREGLAFLLNGSPICSESTRLQDTLIRQLQPNSFSELARIIAIGNGTCVWEDNAEQLVDAGKSLGDCIASRDDIVQHLMAMGMDMRDAYEIMESVRKGQGVSDRMKQKMKLIGVPVWYVDSCDKIRYLWSKSQAVEHTLLYWRLAYYHLYFGGSGIDMIERSCK